jgi:plastocyanin
MRRTLGSAMVVALLASACGLGGGSGAAQRTVLVDYSHDEFASFMIANFPKEVTVAAGDTLVFKQIWTGEPHTVTGGSLVDEMMDKGKPLLQLFGAFEALVAKGVDLPEEGEQPDRLLSDMLRTVEESDVEPHRTDFIEAYDALVRSGSKLPPRDNPGTVTNADTEKIIEEEADPLFEGGDLPYAFDEEAGGIAQNAGQPCFLVRGGPPKEPAKSCTDGQQRQPVFDGKQSYYNSGVIPYEGPQGNTFTVELAPDIDPGSYFFYCAVHGPSQYTEVKVRPEGSDVPSQEAVGRRARQEIALFAEPMLRAFRDARDGEIEIDGKRVKGPFAGLSPEVHGSINEFVPKQLTAKVGEKVTWKLMGSDHTVSFDVPEYFPVIQFANDGTVSLNPKLEPPAGGSPKIPEQEGPPGVLRVDGGTYDGTGFFSSGLFGAQPYAEYSLRFSKPGTYRFACLLHPPMVGVLEVT